MKRICLEFYFYREVGPGYFDSFGQLLVNSKRKSNAFRLKAMMQAALWQKELKIRVRDIHGSSRVILGKSIFSMGIDYFEGVF